MKKCSRPSGKNYLQVYCTQLNDVNNALSSKAWIKHLRMRFNWTWSNTRITGTRFFAKNKCTGNLISYICTYNSSGNSSLPSKNIISTRDLYIDISLWRITANTNHYSPILLRLHSLNLLKSSVVRFNRSRRLKFINVFRLVSINCTLRFLRFVHFAAILWCLRVALYFIRFPTLEDQRDTISFPELNNT